MIEPGGTYAFHYNGGEVIEGFIGDAYPTMLEVFNVDTNQRFLIPRYTQHLLYIEDLSEPPEGPDDGHDDDEAPDDDGPNGGTTADFTILFERSGDDIYINGEKI